MNYCRLGKNTGNKLPWNPQSFKGRNLDQTVGYKIKYERVHGFFFFFIFNNNNYSWQCQNKRSTFITINTPKTNAATLRQ